MQYESQIMKENNNNGIILISPSTVAIEQLNR